MEALVTLLSWACLLVGGIFVLIGGLGLVRFPDFFTRLHAAGVTDTLGAWTILAGLVLQAGISQAALKLVLIWLVLVFTGPTATHALAKAALHGGVQPLLDGEGGDEHRASD